MGKQSENSVIESDALKANMLETSYDVEIASEYKPLLEVVAGYKGLHASLEKLLYEICHPFRNWKIVLPQLRSFVLKNIHYYIKHENGPRCIALFAGFFMDSLVESRRSKRLLAQAVSAEMVWLDKLLARIPKDDFMRFASVINEIFTTLYQLHKSHPDVLMHFVQGQHPVSKIAGKFVQLSDDNEEIDLRPCARFLQVTHQFCYEYWLREDDPLNWFLDRCSIPVGDFTSSQLFESISHEVIRVQLDIVRELDVEHEPQQSLNVLIAMPEHLDFVKYYREMPTRLLEAEEVFRQLQGKGPVPLHRFKENRKLLFLFKIMDTKGLYLIHEETLREINRSLVQLIRQQSFEEIEQFLLTTFKLLKANVQQYPHTSLQCIQVLGGEVFARGNSQMVEAFLWEVVRFGFQHANVVGVDENWQPLANPAHLANIRVWLHLIEREPKWCSTLFSALIIHLKLSGTCVKDTDLFQRDVTELLNHPIEPIRNPSTKRCAYSFPA